MKRILAMVALLALAFVQITPAKADPAGNVNPGTAGTQSWLSGCYTYASTPAPAAGQQMGVPCPGTPGGGLAGSTVTAISAITAPTVNPTISTAAYTAGFVLGGVEQFTIPVTGIVQSVVSDFNTGAYVGGVDWLIFNANPTGGGTTDHAALGIVAADMPKLLGVIHASDCKLTATVTSYCQSGNSPQAFKVAAGTILYVVKQVIGAPTFTNATDDTDTLLIIQ